MYFQGKVKFRCRECPHIANLCLILWVTVLEWFLAASKHGNRMFRYFRSKLLKVLEVNPSTWHWTWKQTGSQFHTFQVFPSSAVLSPNLVWLNLSWTIVPEMDLEKCRREGVDFSNSPPTSGAISHLACHSFHHQGETFCCFFFFFLRKVSLGIEYITLKAHWSSECVYISKAKQKGELSLCEADIG